MQASGATFRGVDLSAANLRGADLSDADLLEVRAATPGVPPTVTVLEASAGASGGYAAISPGSVTVTWTGVER